MQPIPAQPGEMIVTESGPGEAPLRRDGTAVGEDRLAELVAARVARAVRRVAVQQRLPLTRVSVRLRPEDEGPLALDVLLEGPLEAKQRGYLMAIARAASVRRR